MAVDLGKKINEYFLNDIQNSLDYKSKMMLGEQFASRTRQVLRENGINEFGPTNSLNSETARNS